MAGTRSRAIWSALLGGLLGMVSGCTAGRYLASPQRPAVEKKAEGLDQLIEPLGKALEAALVLRGCIIGGMVGAVAGVACGAGLSANGDDSRGVRVKPVTDDV